MASIFEVMLELPLFQGLSTAQLTSIVEKIPFHFKKYRPNEYIIHQGDPCDEIIFVLSGRVRVITPIFKESILIAEDFAAPYTIPFYRFFGREISHQISVYAQGAVGVMTLNKENFLKVIETNRIMLINTLNILSTHAQNKHFAMDAAGESEPQFRLATWLLAFTYRLSKNTIIDADDEDWCVLLNVDIETLHKTIDILTEEKCIEYEDGKLKLIDRYGLQTFVSRNKAQI